MRLKIELIFKFILILFWGISIIAFLFSMVEAITNHTFDFSNDGFKRLIDIFLRYKEIFYTTIILTTAFYTIKSFIESRQSSRRDLWVKIFRETLNELRSENGVIYKTCLLDIEKLFNFSNSINARFEGEKDLRNFLNEFVRPEISKFEMDSEEYKKFNGIYPNDDYSYSERTYFEILIHIGQPTTTLRDSFINTYQNIYRDILKTSEFGLQRKINNKEFTERMNRPPIRTL
jgi:hypothetical protein